MEATLTDIQEKSEETFLSCLQQQVNTMLVKVETPPRDLSPTPAITQLLALLRDMLSTASMNEGREKDMGKVIMIVFIELNNRIFTTKFQEKIPRQLSFVALAIF